MVIKTTEIQISKIIRQDVSQLAACNKAVLPVYYSKPMFRQFIKDPTYLLLKATTGTTFLGYIIGRLENPQRFHIITFGVYPKHRRLGLGTKMMHQIEMLAQEVYPEVQFLTLYVQESNADAIGFYERYGLKRIQVKEDYYGEGQNGYTYGKKFNREE